MNSVIVLTGPTATGKTALSVMLAKEIGGEIVNADAFQVYRGMDVGTAKPSLEERGGVPHHLIDVADPAESYSVSRYVAEAVPVIDDIFARGNTPVIVGGTLLYIDSLLSGRTFADTDPKLRAELYSLPDPYARLQLIDPESAAKIHPSNKIRVIRALEIFYLTGKTKSETDRITRDIPPRYPSVKIALNFIDRENLYSRIDKRVDVMVKCGLIDEVRKIGIPTLAIGYKEITAALNGEFSISEAVERIKKASRNYAKRQLTWLRSEADLNWIHWENEPDFVRGLREATYFANKFCK
ncbi:MAG: tRNA (adenosine(37)-N6)-dimethylallyltransferase MiaA [Oscillospiraceae bacterium]|jgi:tRNA dimethylallyltransferase|nr:tRNA (adenosine(37)-N6)-dimethylallyltransferase MiaA [Oscillospiraceae bacterium]